MIPSSLYHVLRVYGAFSYGLKRILSSFFNATSRNINATKGVNAIQGATLIEYENRIFNNIRGMPGASQPPQATGTQPSGYFRFLFRIFMNLERSFERMAKLVCKNCQIIFNGRPNRKYCSIPCRRSAERAKKIKKYMKTVLPEWRDLADPWPDFLNPWEDYDVTDNFKI